MAIGNPIKILVVCTGNICRSPLAEAALRCSLPEGRAKIWSAGIAAPIGAPADKLSIAAGRQLGVIVPATARSRRLSLADIEQADVILTMENGQKWTVIGRSSRASGKTYLLGQWTCGEIEDPIGMGADIHSRVARDIVTACGSWVSRLGMIANV